MVVDIACPLHCPLQTNYHNDNYTPERVPHATAPPARPWCGNYRNGIGRLADEDSLQGAHEPLDTPVGWSTKYEVSSTPIIGANAVLDHS